MYTQFEAYNAHKCFPCFDQPDLKAKLQFYSVSPSQWKVISNDPVEKVYENQTQFYDEIKAFGCESTFEKLFKEDIKFEKFLQTERISTYLYAFVVGPYEFIEYDGQDKNKYVPLKLYARKSFIKYVDANMFFQLTKSGMDYYSDFFGIPYPFRKYD